MKGNNINIFIDSDNYSYNQLCCYYGLLKSIVADKEYTFKEKDIYISKLNLVIDTYLPKRQKEYLHLYFGLSTGKSQTASQIIKNDHVMMCSATSIKSSINSALKRLYDFIHIFSKSEYDRAVKNRSICLLDISMRSRKAIEHSKIDSIDELLSMTREDISKIYGLGRKYTDEVWDAIYVFRKDVLKPVPERPLSELNLSNRVYNALRRADINTVADLVKLSSKDLTKLNDIGNAAVIEILDNIDEYLKEQY